MLFFVIQIPFMLLSTEDTKDFFRLHAGVMHFVQGRTGGGKGSGCKPKHCSKLPIAERFELHQRFGADPQRYLSDYLRDNPDGLSDSELADIAAWKDAVTGQFIFFRQLKKHLVVIETSENPRVFGVLGLTQPVGSILRQPLPALGTCTLLPFRGVIVCDGCVSSSAVYFGKGYRESFGEVYREAKKAGRVIATFDPPHAAPARKPGRRVAASGSVKKADPVRRLVSSLRRRLGDYRAERDVLRRFEEEMVPAFQAWMEKTFAKQREEVFRLREEIDDLEEALHRLQFGHHPGDAGVGAVDAVLSQVKEADGDGGGLPEMPEEMLQILFQEFMAGMRGIEVRDMDEAAAAEAFDEFRETFRHAAEGNRSAFERTLLGIGADRSAGHVKAVNSAYRRVAKLLHPDKHSNHDEETKELWETLRQAKESLDLETIGRVGTEWRLLRDDDFVQDDMVALKTLQAQLREDFRDLKVLRQDLETHPMWGRKERKPPKFVERAVRAEVLGELHDLRDWKRDLEIRIDLFRRPPASRRQSPRKKGGAASGPESGQLDFGF